MAAWPGSSSPKRSPKEGSTGCGGRPCGRVALELTPDDLLTRIVGVHAVIIRSATRITDEVLAAADELMVIGRAGIGLDNIDVDAATAPWRDGGQRAAEQHRVGGRAHDGVAARPGPQRAAGPRRARRRSVGAQPRGRASSSPTRRSASSASAGSASSSPTAPGRSRCGSSPTTRTCRPSGPARWASSCSRSTRSSASPTSSRSTCRGRKETAGLIDRDLLVKAKPTLRVINVARGGIVGRVRPRRLHPRRRDRRRRARRVRRRAHHVVAAVRARRRGGRRRISGRAPARRRTRPATRSPTWCSSPSPASSCRSPST